MYVCMYVCLYVCVHNLVRTITFERFDRSSSILVCDEFSSKARRGLKFSPLAQCLRVDVMEPLGVILAKTLGFHDFCHVWYHSRG